MWSYVAILILAIAVWAGWESLKAYVMQHTRQNELRAGDKFGGARDAFYVKYLGGHPELRFPDKNVGVILTADRLVCVSVLNTNAQQYFALPYGSVIEVKTFSASERITAWSSSLPIPVSWNARTESGVAVAFRNDAGDISSMGLAPCDLDSIHTTAQSIASEIYGAVYSWKKRTLAQ